MKLTEDYGPWETIVDLDQDLLVDIGIGPAANEEVLVSGILVKAGTRLSVRMKLRKEALHAGQ